MKRKRFLWRVAGLGGLLFAGRALADPHPPGSTGALFPEPPPIVNADPKVRHAETFQIPGKLEDHRTADAIVVSFAGFKATDLTVGKNMVTGIMVEDKVYRKGEKPPDSSEFGLGGSFNDFQTIFLRKGGKPPQLTGGGSFVTNDKLPGPGNAYVVEYKLSIFETDIPVQHMWSPQGGKFYKVLWTGTFTETVE